jgi:hypothetical protein
MQGVVNGGPSSKGLVPIKRKVTFQDVSSAMQPEAVCSTVLITRHRRYGRVLDRDHHAQQSSDHARRSVGEYDHQEQHHAYCRRMSFRQHYSGQQSVSSATDSRCRMLA